MNFILNMATHTILDASKGFDIGQFLQAVLSIICLLIDSVVYYITSWAFKLFLAISQFRALNDAAFDDLISRAYILVGVISLFLIAYALINAIINPDNADKGKMSISKMIKNIIISIIGIAIVPYAFNYFYYFQEVILCNDTIPRLFWGTVESDSGNIEKVTTDFSARLFESFFYPNAISENDDNLTLDDAAEQVVVKRDGTDYTLKQAYAEAEAGKSFFTTFFPFIFGDWGTNGIIDNSVQYLLVLSTVAGGYCAYVLISLCIDMGLRAVKLSYLELIAPLPIMTIIVPGKDSVFKNWLKKTISCAVEVFVRLFVVVFAVYLIGSIKNLQTIGFLNSKVCGLKLGLVTVGLLKALIHCSIFAFIKQAPKFFSEATGIKSDGFKIGITDKLRENGLLQAFGAAGGAATAGVRSFVPNIAKGFATGGVWGAVKGGLNGLAAATNAGQKGWNKAKEAKKWSDVRTAASTAAAETEQARLEREDYKATHGGTTISALKNKFNDKKDDLKDYWLKSHQANYAHESQNQKKLQTIIDADKAATDRAKSILNDHAHEIELTAKDGSTKTLQAIRKDEEDAQQKLNASIQALATTEINGTDAQKTAARAAVIAARKAYDEIHTYNVKLEKSARTDIKRGINLSGKVKADELQDMTSLYNKYQTALKENANAIADKETYDRLKALSDLSPTDFREAIINTEDKSRPQDERVVAYDENGNLGVYSAADAIKLNNAKVISRMNKEGEAVRKQQENKK